MDKKLLQEIQREALKKVLAQLKKHGRYTFKKPIAQVKSRAIFNLFGIETFVSDPFTLKPINKTNG